MFRATRPILTSSSRAAISRNAPISALRQTPGRSASTFMKTNLAQKSVSRPLPSQLLPFIQKNHYVTKSPSGFPQGIDPEDEKRAAQQKLERHPESVTADSSVRHLYEPRSPDEVRPVKEGVKDDLKVVQDTFKLSVVPKESYYLGLAGTLPYLATSLATVYLSWDLNTPWPSESGFVNNILIHHDTARQLLSIIEPVQLGYGAVIISFLGAIHWGLEYAEKTPNYRRTRFRYGVGVLASAVAWPTLLLPVEFALTAQFGAFVALYYADSMATVRGWAPSWYGTYRFVLTAVVGLAIVISLIGRAKVGDAQPRLTGLSEKFHEHRGEETYNEKWEKREQVAREEMRKEKEEAEKKKKKEEEKKAKEEEKKAQEEEKKTKGKEAKEGDDQKDKKDEQDEKKDEK
ncbi:hypothetical protein F4778DRAFT_758712 [Xylariomycetidae sp. FL2044]|nr:hypothetical protein F4778DRAFT_758712 [Xylariomycetidae sp. FL2044]